MAFSSSACKAIACLVFPTCLYNLITTLQTKIISVAKYGHIFMYYITKCAEALWHVEKVTQLLMLYSCTADIAGCSGWLYCYSARCLTKLLLSLNEFMLFISCSFCLLGRQFVVASFILPSALIQA